MKSSTSCTGDFQKLWKKQYGQELSEKQSKEYEERMTQFIRFVLRLEQRERGPP